MRNRGAALWGNLVITGAGIAPPRIIATDKETGKVVWETSFPDTPDVTFTSAPLAIKDKIVIGAANGDQGVRDWIGALDAATGKLVWRKFTIPAPGEPGSETWKDNHNAWQTGGGAVWVTGTYDPDSNQTFWGTGNPVPMFDPTYRPGDNLYTNSAISWDPDTGKMNWYFQYTPGDMWDYDAAGTHILIDGMVAGQSRKLVIHSGRNGFLYTMERSNGQMVLAKPYMDNVNWTKGIDQKTGKPLDYDPSKDIQTYAGIGNLTPGQPPKKVCPSQAGGNNYWPSSYSPQTKLLYIPALTACTTIAIDTAEAQQGKRLERRQLQHDRTLREQSHRGRSGDRRDQEERAPALPQLQRHAGDRRRPGVPRLAGRHGRGIRRHHAGGVVEDQRRLGIFRAADDVRGQRQAICRDRIGTEPGRPRPAGQYAGAQGAAKCAGALCLRALGEPSCRNTA